MNPDITVLIVGLILVAIGIALRIYVSRKRFYRRGDGGLQQFSSYGKAVATTFFEKIVKLVGTISVIAGLFFLLITWYNHRSAVQYREKKEVKLSNNSKE